MITVQITNRFEQLPVDSVRLKKLVRTICKRFGVTHARISIGIVDDAESARLNRQFLNHEGPTDSLSFDLSDDLESKESAKGRVSSVKSEAKGRAHSDLTPETSDLRLPLRVFDLIVNAELAVREAARRGHEARAELALYITHGLLHQLGFDDTTAEQARRMHETEDEILLHLGYGLVYNEDREAQ